MFIVHDFQNKFCLTLSIASPPSCVKNYVKNSVKHFPKYQNLNTVDHWIWRTISCCALRMAPSHLYQLYLEWGKQICFRYWYSYGTDFISNTLRPRQNGRHFPNDTFQMNFLERKCVNFDSDFTEVCSQWSNEQYSSIRSDNGLAPARRQAIIWTNDGEFTDAFIRHSASMN